MNSTFQPTIMSHKNNLADWEKISITIGLTILSILTLFGNTLVVLSFYTYRPLRTLTNYFIVSLSMSDILVAVLSMPIWITFVLMDMDFRIHEGKLLKAWTCFDIMFGVASIWNLTAVSVDRCIHITRPLTHSKFITKYRVIGTIIFIWMLSCGISMVKGLYWTWKRPNYEMLIFSVGFLVPLAVITFCYIRIYAAARLQQIKQQLPNPNLKKRLKRDMKAVKTIAIVVLAFVICWCPFFILNVVHGWCECKINTQLVTIAKWLHYCNSAINPIIYACFNKDYRRGFKSAIYKYARKKEANGTLHLLNRSSFSSYMSTGEKTTPVRRSISVAREKQLTPPIDQRTQELLMKKHSTTVIQKELSSSPFLTTNVRPQAL